LSVPLYFINIHDFHGWGDDFALYIKEAQNIASGKPYYQTNYVFNQYNNIYSPPQYPPGFPLMLAPIVKIWGLSFKAMFYFNSVIATCLLFALFTYFRRKNIASAIAICLSVAIVYSGYFLDLKGNVLSDIPCMLFTTLYIAYRDGATSWKRIFMLIVFAVAAIQIRSQAIFLLAGEALYLLFFFAKTTIKEKKFAIRGSIAPASLYLIAGVVILNLLIDKVILYTPANTTSFYGWFMEFAFNQGIYKWGRDNFHILHNTIIQFFYYRNDNGILKSAIFFVQSMALVSCVAGFVMSIKERIAFEDIFFMIMCVLVVYYPVHDPRYFLPAVPILFYYCYVSLNAIIPVIFSVNSQKAIIAGTVLYVLLGYSFIKDITLHPAAGTIPRPKELMAFEYIRRHVNDNDIVVYNKPRVLTLFTDKRSMCFSWEVSDEMNGKIFDTMQVKYMLVMHGFEDDFFKRYLRNIHRPVDSVDIADGYTLYSLR
jgi:hypothetical protein